MSAAAIQQHCWDLLRGELAGDTGPRGPEAKPDNDLPLEVSKYSLDGIPIYSAEDHDLVNTFLPQAFAAGIGQQRLHDVLLWGFNEVGPTPEKFTRWALPRGWSDKQIAGCITWFRAEAERHGR
jgi:hypothetical protein